jgi:RimJ/RimL family protein N-acetyltransferase
MASRTRYALDFPFETPRLRLEPVAVGHAELIWDWTRHPGFNEFTEWPQPGEKAQARELIERSRAAWDAGDSFLYFGRSKAAGTTLACVESRYSTRRPTLGGVRILIAPEQWSQGFGFELVFFGLWYCFEMLGVEVVALDPYARHGAINKILDEVGMHAIFPHGQAQAAPGRDTRIRYVLTRDEFEIRHLPFMIDAGYVVPRPDLTALGVTILLSADDVAAGQEPLRL